MELSTVTHACFLSYSGDRDRGLRFKASLGKKVTETLGRVKNLLGR
jgi:hypothetical protein